MTSAQRISVRKLALGVAIISMGAIGAVSFAADDALQGLEPTPQQSEAMAQLVAPPPPDAHAVAASDKTAVPEPWSPATHDCVDRLDAYIAPMMIPFREGDAQVMADNAPLLSHIAALVTACDGAHLMVAGHASGNGTDAGNLALSWERADETLNLLVSLGVDPAVLEAIGYGARAPIAQGSDDEDGANRRVDFRVLRQRD